ncbi:uncharacterized protein JCM6883_007569 [Sporobolomyces salmoneus]|uniref:uncharacterized protein n=1 Tax=Sporobolomyces salmoneus TaxID=183962 RepID=UPI00316EAF2B
MDDTPSNRDQDAKPSHPERPVPTPHPPTPSDLERLAPIPEVRDTRFRSKSNDSTTSSTRSFGGGQSSTSHLPPLPPTFHTNLDQRGEGRTSEPSPLQSSIGYSLSKLLTLSSFTSFISSQHGYQDFWEYLLAYSSPHLHTLELQRDLQALIRLTSHSSSAARAMRDVYCTPSGEKKVMLKADLDGDGDADFMSDMGDALMEIAEPPDGLERASRHLLQELYQNEFEAFVKHRLLAHTKLQLEKRDLNQNDVAGLGEAFVLSNPKLHDCPIVLASPAFSALTGYTQEEIIGRNCRFLQGESTEPGSVNEIRIAIKEQRSITQLLLNYDKSGAPFFNLLCIVPLFSPSGELIYFIGGQTDVTGALGNGSRLALPGGSRLSQPAALTINSPEINLSAFSPVVQTFQSYANSPSVRNISPSPSNKTGGEEEDLSTRSDTPTSTNQKPESIHSTSTTSTSSSSHIQPTSGDHYGSELVDLSTAPSSSPSTESNSSSTNSDKKQSSGSSTTLPIRPKPFSRSSASNLNRNSFLGPKSWTKSSSEPGKQKNESNSGKNEKEPRLEYQQGTVERRIHDFQTTYEKVILVSRAGKSHRKILFNTSAFLRFCGLPASTAAQIDNSALIQTDLLDVIKGPSNRSESTSDVKNKISKAFEEGKPCSVQCGIKVGEEKKTIFSRARSAAGGVPTAHGVLHLTPMKDINEQTTAYVAIFA